MSRPLAALLVSFVAGIGIFATIYLSPLFLGRVRGFSAQEIGWTVFSTGVFQLLAIPVYTYCARRVDLRWLLMIGLGCFAVGIWSFTPITHEWGWRELLLPFGALPDPGYRSNGRPVRRDAARRGAPA